MDPAIGDLEFLKHGEVLKSSLLQKYFFKSSVKGRSSIFSSILLGSPYKKMTWYTSYIVPDGASPYKIAFKSALRNR